jgi:hypothetical protein
MPQWMARKDAIHSHSIGAIARTEEKGRWRTRAAQHYNQVTIFDGARPSYCER